MEKNSLEQIKSFIRDINLEMVMSKHEMGINIKNRYNKKIRILMPNRKLIKYITKIGGVLTGSRSLKCLTIDGKEMLDRKSNDWDFIITQEMAYKICDKFKKEYNLVDKLITIEKCRWVSSSSFKRKRS